MAQDHQGHHDHHHGHHHHGSPGETTVGRLGGAAAINVGFAIVQVLVGLALGSIVVLADALHQVTDAVGLLTAVVALWLTSRPSDGAMTFGWGKADALGGYTSALLLLASVAWIVIEAIDRLRNPTEVSGTGVILIGVAGIIVNGGSVLLLGHGQQLALRAARLHLLVDLAGSVIVVVSGVLLLGTSLDWIDPAASLLVNALVLHGTVRILRAASAELLDRSPAGAEPDVVRTTLLTHPEVSEVHHVHSRALAPGVASVTAHIVLDGDLSVHDAQTELDRLRHTLAHELDIHHTTLQLECHDCGATSHG